MAENIKNWVEISSVMIGVSLTVLTLMIGFRYPLDSIFLRASAWALLVAVILFTNAVTTNAKTMYEMSRGSPQNIIDRWVKFAEFSFGLGFTMVLSAFAFVTYQIVDIIAPTILLGSAWLIMMFYTYLDAALPDLQYKWLRSLKRNVWFLIELGVLLIIYIDWLNLF